MMCDRMGRRLATTFQPRPLPAAASVPLPAAAPMPAAPAAGPERRVSTSSDHRRQPEFTLAAHFARTAPSSATPRKDNLIRLLDRDGRRVRDTVGSLRWFASLLEQFPHLRRSQTQVPTKAPERPGLQWIQSFYTDLSGEDAERQTQRGLGMMWLGWIARHIKVKIGYHRGGIGTNRFIEPRDLRAVPGEPYELADRECDLYLVHLEQEREVNYPLSAIEEAVERKFGDAEEVCLGGLNTFLSTPLKTNDGRF